MFEFGFIGTGNMAAAICEALVKSVSPKNVLLSNRTAEKAENLAKKLGCEFGDNKSVALECKYIFLGVKPQMLGTLADEIKPYLESRQDKFILVSMAAGRSTENITELFGSYPVIRIMPNVACAVGEGVTLCAKNTLVTEVEYSEFLGAMKESGKTDDIPENLIDAASAVSGCGPAFVYEIIESLADGAVACGVPRDKAYLYAAQTLLGSAKLMLETKKSPATLKDSVCSPGGTTIQGLRKLEEGGLRSSLIEAVIASYEKALNI